MTAPQWGTIKCRRSEPDGASVRDRAHTAHVCPIKTLTIGGPLSVATDVIRLAACSARIVPYGVVKVRVSVVGCVCCGFTLRPDHVGIRALLAPCCAAVLTDWHEPRSGRPIRQVGQTHSCHECDGMRGTHTCMGARVRAYAWAHARIRVPSRTPTTIVHDDDDHVACLNAMTLTFVIAMCSRMM
jgi:hypothetical protein